MKVIHFEFLGAVRKDLSCRRPPGCFFGIHSHEKKLMGKNTKLIVCRYRVDVFVSIACCVKVFDKIVKI